MIHPIDNIQWLEVTSLVMNDYNPNHVMSTEFNLIKLSIMKQGWIQPILVADNNNGTYTIIDGFHRHYLAKHDKDIFSLTLGKVPCAVLELSVPERKMLTVRINRAKGVHSAVKMHELVSDLYNKHKLTMSQICEGIGANKDEVDLLLKENVFKKLEVETHTYSDAWIVTEEESWYDARRKLLKLGKSEEEIVAEIGPAPTQADERAKARLKEKTKKENKQKVLNNE